MDPIHCLRLRLKYPTTHHKCPHFLGMFLQRKQQGIVTVYSRMNQLLCTFLYLSSIVEGSGRPYQDLALRLSGPLKRLQTKWASALPLYLTRGTPSEVQFHVWPVVRLWNDIVARVNFLRVPLCALNAPQGIAPRLYASTCVKSTLYTVPLECLLPSLSLRFQD